MILCGFNLTGDPTIGCLACRPRAPGRETVQCQVILAVLVQGTVANSAYWHYAPVEAKLRANSLSAGIPGCSVSLPAPEFAPPPLFAGF